MGKILTKITSRTLQFIEKQHVFFVATAPKKGRINLSPKGMNSLKVLTPNQLIWLNVTGSGNETAAHINENGNITIMFCAFEGAPNIVRIYGKAREVKPSDNDWKVLCSKLPKLPGARQIFDVTVASVQTSCGMSVPFYEYKGERNELNEWAENKGEDGIQKYWKEKNQTSIDGLPTHII
ncbi:pyridoxamine 5'-phosphate oxidase family protein [Tenacibaculum geojense]|uniref:Pyridoxamine 5'-phosphate oxidase family protein n=1 Tax=Tenacibaculum geojense TaxID=915352 RepID=A0ABW3JUU4_9FLAO